MDFTAHLEALKDERPQARIDAVAALIKAGTEALTPLASMAIDADLPAHARACAVKALGGIGGPESAEAIIGALADADPVVKIPAAIILGELKHPRAAGALAPLLCDQSSLVRKHASESIVSIIGGCTSAESLVSLKGEISGMIPEGKKTGSEAAYVLGKMVEKARCLMASEAPAKAEGKGMKMGGLPGEKTGAIKH